VENKVKMRLIVSNLTARTHIFISYGENCLVSSGNSGYNGVVSNHSLFALFGRQHNGFC